MKLSRTLAPQNSLIVVLDPATGDIPKSMDNHLVASTPSCIAIGTLSAADGATTVVLTNAASSIGADPAMKRVFEGFIDTPRMEVSVCTVTLETLLSLQVPKERTAIEVWVNHESEPSRIAILVR